jgi:Sigma 54 modulation/S30EA ribosomal protein C terminus
MSVGCSRLLRLQQGRLGSEGHSRVGGCQRDLRGVLPDRVTASAVQVRVSDQRPPQLTIAEARDRLEQAGWPFVFFRDPATDRGRLLYRRSDGHYRLIVPVE